MQKHELQQLKQRISDCGYQKRRLFSQRFSRLDNCRRPVSIQQWQKLVQDVDQSLCEQVARRDNRPEVVFANDLPVHEHLASISEKIKNNQVVILCGETGSGKTTQLPKLCLAEGYGIKGLIGHTQPRRIAAKSIASRLASELDSELGTAVSYKIRHQDQTTEQTYIKVMTDGVLLAEMQHDRLLTAYDVLIIDEAHERSLNIDFILGYLQQLLPKRPELRLIITSATIDVERFSEHFSNAPIIEVSGRSYPVEIRYRPLEDNDDTLDLINERALLAAIDELSQENLGDILVFLSGERDIREMMAFLQKQSLTNTEILPLYSRLSAAAQAKIFKTHRKRHIILATNVAETSLTIDGISHVIDFGYARISRYSYKSKVQRLPIEKISQASAAQRTGRCGRTHEGICIRLFSEDDFRQRPRYTEPEILRTNLATVILQMKSMKLGDISDFPFLDPPRQRFINDGLRLLHELSAVDQQQNLTSLGKQLSRLPIDPRLGRMLLAANHWNCLAELLVIVSALSIQDPRERPLDATEKVDKAHSQFIHKHSDFLAYATLWEFYRKQKKALSQNQLKKMCKSLFLSPVRMREWQDVHQQLSDIVGDLKFSMNTEPADYNTIHCAIVTGLLSQIACLEDKKQYIGARSVNLHIFPGSSQFAALPKWIMAAEFSETSRLYARTVAKIDPKWTLKPAKHLLQRRYTEPHWDDKKQHTSVYESIELYGLTIVARQITAYAKVNPVEARTLFIQEALVNLKLQTTARYYEHNKKIIEEVRALEDKTRRFDKLDEQALFDFYDQRLPDSICSLQSLDGWRKQVEAKQSEYLFLQTEDILQGTFDTAVTDAYPDQVMVNQIPIPVLYRFAPGEQDDGVSVELPLVLLNQVDELEFDYLIPGQLREKITHLLKSLPKAIRKQLVPIPDVAAECAENIQFAQNRLTAGLSDYLFRTRGVRVPVESWAMMSIPEHLRINVNVMDENGVCIGQGRDLKEIKEKMGSLTEELLDSYQMSELEQDNITQWDFSDLPKNVSIQINEINVLMYPALVDRTDNISIRLFDTPFKAECAMRAGLNRLFQLQMKQDIKYIKKNFPGKDSIILSAANIYKKDQLLDDVVSRVIQSEFIDNYGIVRSKLAFEEIIERERSGLISKTNDLSRLLKTLFSIYKDVNSLIAMMNTSATEDSIEDVQSQLSNLVFPGFIKQIPMEWLAHYPRYLTAIVQRLEKLNRSFQNDKRKMTTIHRFWSEYLQLNEMRGGQTMDADVERYRWMIEEYRVSIFAQELKTVIKVSPERLDDQLKIIRKKATVVV